MSNAEPPVPTTNSTVHEGRLRRVLCGSGAVLASAALLVAVSSTTLSRDSLPHPPTPGTTTSRTPTTTVTSPPTTTPSTTTTPTTSPTTTTAPPATPVTVISATASDEAIPGGANQVYLSEQLTPADGGISISLQLPNGIATAATPALASDAVCTAAAGSYSCNRVPASFTGVFDVPTTAATGTEVIRNASGTVVRQVVLSWGLDKG